MSLLSFFFGIWKTRHYTLGWLTLVILSPLLMQNSQELKCAYVGLIMMTYWFLEILPIPVTSLVPLVAFPLVGIINSKSVCICYFNVTLMIFLGSLIAATAVEKSSLHIRMALKVIHIFGCSPRRLILGFMLTTGFFSLWISNLAAVAMVLPIVNATMDKLTNHNKSKSLENYQTIEKDVGSMSKIQYEKFHKGFLLGICYASNIGGTGTLTGTPTNLVLNAVLKDRQVSYSQWFFFNMPGVIILIFLSWAFICVFYINNETYEGQEKKQEEIREELEKTYYDLGPMKFPEKAVCALFSIMFFLWVFRKPDFIPGWTSAFTDDKEYIKDQVPAILVAILFFAIPKDPWNLQTSSPLIDWKTAQEGVAWGVILLIGGGFALAKGCEESGLSKMISEMFGNMSANLPISLMCFMLLVVAAIVTECTSNAATCTIMLPIVKPLAKNMNVDPIYLMLPITVACSYATMLPVSSGTNAFIFEYGGMRIKDMLIPGFVVKLFCVAVLYILVHTWGKVVFGFD